MANQIEGTETEKNLLKAFSGESQARNRYTFYAERAEEEGFIFVRDIFKETAYQENIHAKRLFSFLDRGKPLEITYSYPAGKIADTYTNLIESAAGEHEEFAEMYPDFARKAEEEGFKDIAVMMRNIAKSEKYHEQRYLALAQQIKEKIMFHNPTPTIWRCLRCGCIVEGPDAPAKCPACTFPQGWFVREHIEFQAV